MVGAPPNLNATPTGAAHRPWRVPGAAGAVAVVAALWAVGVCLSETPAAAHSPCGTCRWAARSSLYGEAVWAVGVSAAAAVGARLSGCGEFRVARSAAVVGLVVWVASVGFVRGWW